MHSVIRGTTPRRAGPPAPLIARRVARRAVVAVLGLALGLMFGCGRSSDSERNGPIADEAALASPGAYGSAVRQLDLVDRSRSTAPNGDFPGSPERTLAVRVWYPTAPSPSAGDGAAAPVATDGAPFPLIGYAHGFMSANVESAPLKEHLASHGYVVVAPSFPLSNGAAPGGPIIGDIANQPGDLEFVMRAVASPDGAAPDLAQVIDSSRQAVVGLSLGGGTVLIAAYHPLLHLRDIGAAVALAPASCFFGKPFYSRSLPTLILAGDADELVPLGAGPALAFEYAPPPVGLVRLVGGNHIGFIGIDVPGAENSDRTACAAVAGADPARGVDGLAQLVAGTTPDVLNQDNCGTPDDPVVCATPFVQTMRGTRQQELTAIATLAHLEAELRGRADARRFLERAFAERNEDVEVSIRH